MDSLQSPTTGNDAVISPEDKDSYSSMVDPFLVEVLQNPRHRLTILRMELDIQKFLQNSSQQHFEFQHFPTSYLRLAAHRVAQHYGLQTMVLDNFIDGQGTKIVARKTPETAYPAVALSEIPAKQSENDKQDRVKIVIRPRPTNSLNGNGDFGNKRSSLKSVEERKEEYDRARARIFSTPGSSPEPEDRVSRQSSLDGKNFSLTGDENVIELDKYQGGREANSSRVAIFRDMEKDRSDPDYDRSYDRYVKNLPVGPSFSSMATLNMQQNFQPPYLQYESVFPHLGQQMAPGVSPPVYRHNTVMSPFCAVGVNQPSSAPLSRDPAMYVQWPSHAMMYAHSYDQFRNAVFQAPFYQQQQQPLSFDYSQNN